MKSDVIKLTANTDLKTILDETEKVTNYTGLDKKDALHIRLLAEELVSSLPHILDISEGEFWIENDGNNYKICVKVEANEKWEIKRAKIVEMSKDGINAVYAGVMGKIRYVIETMFDSDYVGSMSESAYASGYYFESGSMLEPDVYAHTWSLQNYYLSVEEENEEERKDEWDELEKSIIANISDDVIVGIKGKKVDLIIKKTF